MDRILPTCSYHFRPSRRHSHGLELLADGFHIPRNWWGRLLLGALVLIPTYLFAGAFPHLFIAALDISGGFGDAILNGLIPVLLVWSGRYILNLERGFRIPGGIPFLILIALLALLVFGVETYP